MAKIEKIIGSIILTEAEVASTNSRLKEIARTLPEGAVLRVERQTSGRGRFSRAWFSDSKSLIFSLLVRPHIQPHQLPLAALWPAVSVADALRRFGIKAAVKWPNDVIADGLKLAGVLVENSIKADGSLESIVGIGLNVNQVIGDFPKDLQKSAGSMRLCAGGEFNYNDVFNTLLERLDHDYRRFFRPFAGPKLRTAWLKECGHLHTNVHTTVHGSKIIGRFLEIDENGAAVLQVGKRTITVENFESWEMENAVDD